MKKSSVFSTNNFTDSQSLNSKVKTIKNRVSNILNNKNYNLVDHLNYTNQSNQLLINESVLLLTQALRGSELEEVDLTLHNSIHSLRFVVSGGEYQDDSKMFEETLTNLQYSLEWLGRAQLIKAAVPAEYLADNEFKELLNEFVLRSIRFPRPEYESAIKLLTSAFEKGSIPCDFWEMLYEAEHFFKELFISDVVGDNFSKVVQRAEVLYEYCKEFNSHSKSVELLYYITLASKECKDNTKIEYYTDKDLITLTPLYAITGILGICSPGITLDKLYNYYKAITN